MADLRLTDTGDLYIGDDGDLEIITGLDAIRQDLTLRLQTFRGEWFLDERVGIPYFQDILVKSPDINVIRSIFREAILTTDGVVAIDDLTLDYEGATRKLSISFSAQTTSGTLTFERELIIPQP